MNARAGVQNRLRFLFAHEVRTLAILPDNGCLSVKRILRDDSLTHRSDKELLGDSHAAPHCVFRKPFHAYQVNAEGVPVTGRYFVKPL
ncbi:MAG: hypothetical protein QGG25_05195 [Phycisphaerae bacterium]|nr:hypothetical protein [Phycisphaerae bacterium]